MIKSGEVYSTFLFFCFFCILSLICLLFLFVLSWISYPSSFCSCNLDRWWESSLLLLRFISISYVWIFFCYYFAEHFSFLESFKIWSSNIRNDVIRMKCWMKQRVNQSNIKVLLDKPENVGWKICLQSNFDATRFFFIEHDFFFFRHFCVLLNRSNISSIMAFLLCWMKCWIGLTRSLENSLTFTGKKSASKSPFEDCKPPAWRFIKRESGIVVFLRLSRHF